MLNVYESVYVRLCVRIVCVCMYGGGGGGNAQKLLPTEFTPY